MKIKIVIPSYKRAGKVSTIDYVPQAVLCVAENEVLEYKKFYPDSEYFVLPNEVQGNLSRVNNFLLDKYLKEYDVMVRMDDDISYMGYWSDRKSRKLESSEVENFLLKYSLLCEEWGFRMWGVNVSMDKQVYREYSPFSTLSFIGGPFTAHLNHDLRYDLRIPSKDDYDMTVQQINKYRGVLRVNKYFYVCKQAENTGGLASVRSVDTEMEWNKILEKKWGSKIIQYEKLDSSRSHSTKKKRNFDINPILHIPIKGI